MLLVEARERRRGDDPGAGGRGVGYSKGGPSLQERLAGRAFRAHAVVRLEPEPGRLGRSPGAAGVLSGPPRRAAGARDAGRGEDRLALEQRDDGPSLRLNARNKVAIETPVACRGRRLFARPLALDLAWGEGGEGCWGASLRGRPRRGKR